MWSTLILDEFEMVLLGGRDDLTLAAWFASETSHGIRGKHSLVVKPGLVVANFVR